MVSCTSNNECISQYSEEGEKYFARRNWINVEEFEDVQALFQYNSNLERKSRPVLFVTHGAYRIPLESRLIGVSDGAINDYFGFSVLVEDHLKNSQRIADEIEYGKQLLNKKAIENIYFELRLDGSLDKDTIDANLAPLLNELCQNISTKGGAGSWFWPIILIDVSRDIPPPPPPERFNEN